VGLEDHEPGAEVALVEGNHEPVPVERIAAHVPVVTECALHAAILVEAAVTDGGAAQRGRVVGRERSPEHNGFQGHRIGRRAEAPELEDAAEGFARQIELAEVLGVDPDSADRGTGACCRLTADRGRRPGERASSNARIPGMLGN
jgi:hypothetical protein